ncbi:MAG: hypothetical protein LLF96_02250, partial [Eubacteriales bacterium]|nr:hypothetical protein [Eubacteriales bacterium]
MVSPMAVSMINNSMLLLVLFITCELINIIPSRYRRLLPILNGLLISMICVTIMSTPYTLQPGLFFD